MMGPRGFRYSPSFNSASAARVFAAICFAVSVVACFCNFMTTAVVTTPAMAANAVTANEISSAPFHQSRLDDPNIRLTLFGRGIVSSLIAKSPGLWSRSLTRLVALKACVRPLRKPCASEHDGGEHDRGYQRLAELETAPQAE